MASENVILNALINPKAALNGESTFFLADNYEESTKKYEGLRPQESSTYLPKLNSYIVKSEIAKLQPKSIEINPISSVSNENSKSSSELNNKDNSDGSKKTKQKTFTASLKLEPVTASLKTSKFMDEVMSHLQAIPGSEIEMSIEVIVKVNDGIDKDTARIVIENSNALDVDNPEIY